MLNLTEPNSVYFCLSTQRLYRALICILLLMVVSLSWAIQVKETSSRPFYGGIIVGYGSTTWSKLIDPYKEKFVTLTTPIAAKDSGFGGGILIGWQLSRNFAAEFYYFRYPKSYITFKHYSLYQPYHRIISKTESFSMVGKFIVPTDFHQLSFYASAGLSITHRRDVLTKRAQATGAFGVGVIKPLKPNIDAEFSFQYHTGFAISELKPVLDYIPFLYSLQFRLIYHLPIYC